jgi:hypothetical protein
VSFSRWNPRRGSPWKPSRLFFGAFKWRTLHIYPFTSSPSWRLSKVFIWPDGSSRQSILTLWRSPIRLSKNYKYAFWRPLHSFNKYNTWYTVSQSHLSKTAAWNTSNSAKTSWWSCSVRTTLQQGWEVCRRRRLKQFQPRHRLHRYNHGPILFVIIFLLINDEIVSLIPFMRYAPALYRS